MQFAKLGLIAAAAATVSAQSCSIANLPPCAITPAVSAIGSTGCGTDIGCVCKNSAFLTALTPMIRSACSDADFRTAVSVAACLCLPYGVTITVPGSAPVTSASTSISASAAPVTSASSTPVTTVTLSTTVAAVTITTTASVGTVTASVTSSTNGTFTTSAPAVVTANAAAGQASWAVAGLLGVGAFLVAM